MDGLLSNVASNFGLAAILDRPGGGPGVNPVNGFTSGEFVQGVRFGKRFYLRRIRGCGTENGVCASICTGGGETGTFPNLGASLAVWVGGFAACGSEECHDTRQ